MGGETAGRDKISKSSRSFASEKLLSLSVLDIDPSLSNALAFVMAVQVKKFGSSIHFNMVLDGFTLGKTLFKKLPKGGHPITNLFFSFCGL